MNQTDPHQHYKSLKAEINFHNYRYHVMDAPVISDYEYDRLLLQLREIEAEHPDWITPDSPTQRAGATPAEGFPKVQQEPPFRSRPRFSRRFGRDQ